MKHRANQLVLPLTQVTVERGISLFCIPDRDSAECEFTRLRARFGPNLIKSAIRKDKPGKRITYTLRLRPRALFCPSTLNPQPSRRHPN